MSITASPPFRSSASSSSLFDPFDFFYIASPVDGDSHTKKLAKDVSALANTRLDWVETPEAHVFKVDLPGLSKAEIKVQLEDDTLQISGERKKEETHKADKCHRLERPHGSFLRRLALPENANPEEIKAEVLDGVLTVNVPKHPKPTPQVRDVVIN